VAAQDADDPGVLILSRFAGAAAELREAILVNPYDPEAVGAAISHALEMPVIERQQRHAALFKALLKNDISQWGDRFLTSLTGRSDIAPPVELKATKPLHGLAHPPHNRGLSAAAE